MRRVCVFCGSSGGGDPIYAAAARQLGRVLAEEGSGLVYGGASVGLMGIMADAALVAGGDVIGVIPHGLFGREVSHAGLPDLRTVATMHERKALMADLADGFITLPGGYGTLDELFEIVTWAQLGIHKKPCGILNVAGYFTPLLGFLDRLVAERFLRTEHRALLLVEDDPVRLLARFADYRSPVVEKWLDLEAP